MLTPLLVVLAADVAPLPKQESSTLTVTQEKTTAGGAHYAVQCSVRTDAGTSRLPGRGLPLVEHVLELDGGWVLLGYNTTGTPVSPSLQVVKQDLALGQKLSWFTERDEPCVLLEKASSGWRVGLPKGRHEHTLRIAADVKPTFEDFVATEATWSYCPPKHKPMPEPRQVAWYAISADGFQPAAK